MRKTKLVIQVLILLLIISISSSVFALSGLDDWLNTAKEWTNTSAPANSSEVYENVNKISGVLWIFGLFAFIIIGVVLGIKYMFAPGIEEKADIKKSMPPLIIGGLIVLGAVTIWRILLIFFDEVI